MSAPRATSAPNPIRTMSSTTTKRRAPQRKRRPSSKTKRTLRRARDGATEAPGWGDLSKKGKKKSSGSAAMRHGAAFLEGVSTVRFALVVLALAVLCTAYVAHVHATQDLYTKLQHERAENQRLHLKQERLRAEFDRATGPAVIYRRAPELGLEEDVAYGPTIVLDKE